MVAWVARPSADSHSRLRPSTGPKRNPICSPAMDALRALPRAQSRLNFRHVKTMPHVAARGSAGDRRGMQVVLRQPRVHPWQRLGAQRLKVLETGWLCEPCRRSGAGSLVRQEQLLLLSRPFNPDQDRVGSDLQAAHHQVGAGQLQAGQFVDRERAVVDDGQPVAGRPRDAS
jgi:hypothetical protein